MCARSRSVRRKLIQNRVNELLDNCRVKEPPVDLERIVHSLDIPIQETTIEGDVDGFVVTSAANHTAVIGVNRARPLNRRRFTIAHELGHALLHTGETVHVDVGFEVKLRNSQSSEGVSLEEKEANLFAAELLMPERFLHADLDSFGSLDLENQDSIRGLARKYQVSSQAMTFRLAYLGVLDL